MLIAAAFLLFQPPAPAAVKADEVCLTNACAPKPALVRDERAIAAAMRAGDMPALVRTGGTAVEAGQLLRDACQRSPAPGCDNLHKPDTESWSVNSRGEVTLAGQVEPRTIMGPDGQPRTGGSFMTRIMPGVEPRPDMERPRSAGPAFAARPVTEPAVRRSTRS